VREIIEHRRCGGVLLAFGQLLDLLNLAPISRLATC
jgi:hypothetical protein